MAQSVDPTREGDRRGMRTWGTTKNRKEGKDQKTQREREKNAWKGWDAKETDMDNTKKQHHVQVSTCLRVTVCECVSSLIFFLPLRVRSWPACP